MWLLHAGKKQKKATKNIPRQDLYLLQKRSSGGNRSRPVAEFGFVEGNLMPSDRWHEYDTAAYNL